MSIHVTPESGSQFSALDDLSKSARMRESTARSARAIVLEVGTSDTVTLSNRGVDSSSAVDVAVSSVSNDDTIPSEVASPEPTIDDDEPSPSALPMVSAGTTPAANPASSTTATPGALGAGSGIINVSEIVDIDPPDSVDDLGFDVDVFEPEVDDGGGAPAAVAISSSLPVNPEPSQTATALPVILARIENLASTSHLKVDDVAESDAVVSEKAQRPDYAAVLKAIRQQMGPDAANISDAVLLRGYIAKKTHPGTGKQRKRQAYATPLSVEMDVFIDGRTLERLEADTLKSLRRDGGTRGPVGLYTKWGIDEGASPELAERMAKRFDAHEETRVQEMRLTVCVMLNLERAERAKAAGINPVTIKYLRVKGD